ncbi:MAG: hypothetical protein KF856_14135 [Cyclobacteriaceae bacterium]|nr:hypothetical protein [Cyclobacteriaceae bacterium]
MKTAFTILILVSTQTIAQQQFDYVMYHVPTGWGIDTKRTDVVQLTVMDTNDGTYAMAGIYPSQQGLSSASENFNQAWEQIAQQTVSVTSQPQLNQVVNQNGWQIISGSTSFKDRNTAGWVWQVVATQQARYIAVILVTNSNKYQATIDQFIQSLKFLPLAAEVTSKTTVQPISSQSYSFQTTNFDDGWSATAESDFVTVTKGNLKVLVHYPNAQADAYNSVLRDGLATAWSVLVAPRYTNIRNLEVKPIQSWESVSFASADGIEKASGKQFHIVLFKKHYSNGNGRYLEFVAPNKQTYDNEFVPYHNDEFGWDKNVNMQYRNKFAVAATDLTGTWGASDYASLSYYYVNGGGYAGDTATSLAHIFTFNPNGTYQSDHAGASGVVGNQKFSRQVYNGKFSSNNWTLTLTNRFQGETENFACQFEAVKGGRILLLTDKLGTVYTLAKRQ